MKYFKDILVIVIFFLPAVMCFAQREKIDSLEKVLPGLNDTARVDCLNALSKAYIWLHIDSSEFIANKALKEAKTFGYINGIISAYDNLAWIKWFLANNYPEMEDYCRKAIQLMGQTRFKDQLANFYFLLGLPLLAQSEYSRAIEAFTKARQIFAETGDELSQANMYAYIAYAEQLRGHYGSSLDYSVKWLHITKKYNDIQYLDIWAELYKVIGDYETALDYFQQAAKHTKITQKIDELGFFTRAIGEVYFLQKKYDSALIYYNRLTDLFASEDIPNPFLGELYLALHKYEDAQQNLLYALKYYKKANGLGDVMWVLLRLSMMYKEKGDSQNAIHYAAELLQIAYKTGARQYMRDGHLILYQLSASSGKQRDAFNHLEKYTVIKDSLDKDLSAQQLAFYKISAEKEKDLSRINLLNEEKKLQQQKLNQTAQQKNFLIAGITALILVGSILFRFIMLKRKNEKQRLEHELELNHLESEKVKAELQRHAIGLEMQALRAQMNPHFIFNSLNAINKFILQNNKEQASRYLAKFSRLIRLILQNSQASLITLESEIESLELYLEMEVLRFNYHFAYKISFPDDLDIEALKVPPLIIQPYAENAIWHGLMHKEEKGHLEIEIYQYADHMLCCKITDDGIGRKKAAEFKSKSIPGHKSMGMSITADRIAILQQKEQTEATIQITDLTLPDGNAGGTEVLLKIPVLYD